eukprot:54178-Rhodomonas_salina.2
MRVVHDWTTNGSNSAILLRAPYAMSGTDICTDTPGTNVQYGRATRRGDNFQEALLAEPLEPLLETLGTVTGDWTITEEERSGGLCNGYCYHILAARYPAMHLSGTDDAVSGTDDAMSGTDDAM